MHDSADVSNQRAPARFPWPEARDIAPVASLAILFAFFAMTTKGFMTLYTLTLILQQGAVLGIVAAGLTFVLLCGEIDLSVGMLALWSACFCGFLFELPFAAGPGGHGHPPSWALLVVFLVPLASSLALGFISGVLTVWSRLPSFLMTLAMMYIAHGAAARLTRSEKLNVPEVLKELGNQRFELAIAGGIGIPYSAVFAAVVLLISHLVLRHTRFGRYVYMTGGNREAARLAGVNTQAIIVACLSLSALLAGMGGMVNAGRLNSVTLDQNADLLLNAVACVVLGGTSLFGGEGGIGRTAIGVFTFSLLTVGLARIEWIDDLMRPFVLGVVLMVAMVINGLLARRSADE